MTLKFSNDDPAGNGHHQALGQLLEHFPVSNQKTKRWLPLLLGGAAILASVALTFHLVYVTWLRINIHGRAIIVGIFPLPLGLYGLMCIAGILVLVLAIIHWGDSISLFENGLLEHTAKKEKTWLYDETDRFDSHIIQIMFGGSVVTTRVRIILEGGANNRWVIQNQYERMTDLIQTLRQNILPGLFERARQRLIDGESLPFHQDLQATDRGLCIIDDLTPYGDVEPVIKNRVINLHKKDDPNHVLFKSQITEINNLDLLLDLFDNPPDQTLQSSPK